MRFSIATLLLVVLLVAVYFPLKTLFEPWQRARIGSEHPLYAHQIDCSQLREGDTVETASDIFPTLTLVDPDSDDHIKLEQIATMTGKPLPKNADLYRYQSHGLDGVLTFQNGKLVLDNFDYEDPMVVAQQRLITPSLWFRLGILPIYTLIASLTLVAWVFACRWFKSSNCDTINSQRETSATGT